MKARYLQEGKKLNDVLFFLKKERNAVPIERVFLLETLKFRSIIDVYPVYSCIFNDLNADKMCNKLEHNKFWVIKSGM